MCLNETCSNKLPIFYKDLFCSQSTMLCGELGLLVLPVDCS